MDRIQVFRDAPACPLGEPFAISVKTPNSARSSKTSKFDREDKENVNPNTGMHSSSRKNKSKKAGFSSSSKKTTMARKMTPATISNSMHITLRTPSKKPPYDAPKPSSPLAANSLKRSRVALGSKSAMLYSLTGSPVRVGISMSPRASLAARSSLSRTPKPFTLLSPSPSNVCCTQPTATTQVTAEDNTRFPLETDAILASEEVMDEVARRIVESRCRDLTVLPLANVSEAYGVEETL